MQREVTIETLKQDKQEVMHALGESIALCERFSKALEAEKKRSAMWRDKCRALLDEAAKERHDKIRFGIAKAYGLTGVLASLQHRVEATEVYHKIPKRHYSDCPT